MTLPILGDGCLRPTGTHEHGTPPPRATRHNYVTADPASSAVALAGEVAPCFVDRGRGADHEQSIALPTVVRHRGSGSARA